MYTSCLYFYAVGSWNWRQNSVLDTKIWSICGSRDLRRSEAMSSSVSVKFFRIFYSLLSDNETALNCWLKRFCTISTTIFRPKLESFTLTIFVFWRSDIHRGRGSIVLWQQCLFTFVLKSVSWDMGVKNINYMTSYMDVSQLKVLRDSLTIWKKWLIILIVPYRIWSK